MNDGETPAARGERRHEPVLFSEVLECFRSIDEREMFVDATLGAGGHARAVLESHPALRLLGIDRDPAALEIAARTLEAFSDRVTLVRGRHEELIDILETRGITMIGGLLADLGVSSMQFDEAQRGFSFRYDAPLDMRMSQEGPTAADLVNTLGERELGDVLREYGEEPMWRRIARALVHDRAVEPITTTARLAAIVRSVKRGSREKIDPATLTFQALRIATNREIVGLAEFITAAVDRLKPAGRIAIISFHSLEDRVVKQTLRLLEGRCVCPPRMPVCRCGAVKKVRVITRHPIEASPEEVERNPRSRSAKLRIAERV